MIGLPDGIGAFGTMPVEEFIPITKSRRAVLRKRHHGRMQMTNNPVHTTIGRWRPVARCCERGDFAMNGRNGGTRFAQHHTLDQCHEVRRELAMARIGSFGSDQPRQPGGAVSGKPALSGSEWDTGVTGHLS